MTKQAFDWIEVADRDVSKALDIWDTFWRDAPKYKSPWLFIEGKGGGKARRMTDRCWHFSPKAKHRLGIILNKDVRFICLWAAQQNIPWK